MTRVSAKRLVFAAFIVVLVVLGMTLPVYWVFLLSTVAISALIARSVGLVTNQTGLVTLCQMSFAAIGGWVVSWMALTWPYLPFLLFVLVGGLVAGVMGVVIGIATVRIRGIEFAVVTLGFAAALDLVLRQGSFPGVGTGTAVYPEPPFDDPRGFFVLCWVVLLVVLLGLGALSRTAHGLAWPALKGSERAAAALGVKVGNAKASAVAIGAVVAGLAGGLLAGLYGLLTTQIFTPLTSMVHLATAVLCGASLFSGAVLAGIFAVFIPELLRRVGLPPDIANALLAIAAFDVLRRGNGGLAEQLRAKLEDRAFRGIRRSCEMLPLEAEPFGALSGGPSGGLSGRAGDAAGDAAPCLEVTDLTVAYGGERALDEVSLTVRQGDVHALIGPNGAGKTTLVDAVTGFLPAYSGSIAVAGLALDGLTVHQRVRAGVRRTFQQPRGIDAMTVDEYLRLAGEPARGGRMERSGRAQSGERADARPHLHADVRTFFGLPAGNVPIRMMDVGSRRILEIAGALVSAPRLLLIDEPAAGLDVAQSLELAERVRRLPAHFGCAVLLIEHDMSFVRAASNRATVLDDGRVIASGATGAVLEHPKVIAAYLGTEIAE